MIQTNEMLILFIATIFAVAAVSGLMINMINSQTQQANVLRSEIPKKVAYDIEILEVYENNVFIKVVSGVFRPDDIQVILNGTPVTPVISFVRDEGDTNVANRGDILQLILPTSITFEDCLIINTTYTTTKWGLC